MFSYKVGGQLPIILGLVISGILGVTLMARHVEAGPSSPASPQSSSWVVQDNTIFGDRIEMVSADDGWMLKLGYHENLNDNSVYLYRWNGKRWSLFSTLIHTQLVLRADLEMLSSTDGWIVLGGPLSGAANLAESSIYRWDGNSWGHYATFTAPNAVSLQSIDMLSPTEGWASGPFNFGTIYYHWNGTSWELIKENFSDFTGNDLDMVSPTNGWSVGSGLSHWDGSDWTVVTSPVTTTLNSISMVSPNDGWAVGGGYQQPGAIIRWNGVTWNEVNSPINDRLYDIDMISADDGWIVGENGTLLHWNGIMWTEYPESSIYPYDWLSIDMLSPKKGWIVGYGGVLVYETRPELAVSAPDGAPGSFFTLSGNDYPANEEAIVNVNGHDLGTVTTDDAGAFTLILSTADADEGIYIATVSVNPSAATRFVLDVAAPLRLQEGEGSEIAVPAGIAMTEQLFLPAISR